MFWEHLTIAVFGAKLFCDKGRHPWQERYATMTFNRNFTATPASPAYTPIPINQRATNAAVLPAQQYIPTAAETVLLNPAVSTPSAPVPLIISIPSKALIEGQPFELLVSGDIFVGGATPTAVMKLYSGTSATVGNDQLLATTAAAALLTANTPFYFKATLIGSTGTGKMVGTFKSLFGATIGAEAALAAQISNVNFANNPVANFMLSVTPNNANANSSITIYEAAINFA